MKCQTDARKVREGEKVQATSLGSGKSRGFRSLENPKDTTNVALIGLFFRSLEKEKKSGIVLRGIFLFTRTCAEKWGSLNDSKKNYFVDFKTRVRS
jgi:hypothetical protein